MTKSANSGDRLTALVVRSEHAAQRNREQRTRITAAANAMADHATGFLASIEKRAAAGDVEALRQFRIAARGRARARRLASS